MRDQESSSSMIGRILLALVTALAILQLVLLSASHGSSFPSDNNKAHNNAAEAHWSSSRRLLFRTQFGICHRDVAPKCYPVFNVTCHKGGSLGCWSCEMIQRCSPQAAGCYFHFMDNITYCGF